MNSRNESRKKPELQQSDYRSKMYKLILNRKFSWYYHNLVYSLVFATYLTTSTVIGNESSAAAALDHVKKDGQEDKQPINRLLVMTITKDPNNESFQRFNRSIEAFNLDLTVLFEDKKKLQQKDGKIPHDKIQDTTKGLGKLDAFKRALAVHKNEQDLVVMLVDSSNSIFNGNKKDILTRFNRFNPETKILFSADSKCWPDPKLASKYPKNTALNDNDKSERFLNSEALIGYAPMLWELLNLSNEVTIEHNDDKASEDFQLYCTNSYLDPNIRQKLAIELDHKAELFQNLRSSESSVEVELNSDNVKLKNRAYHTEPVVVHGNGQSKVVLNSLGNYLGKAWTPRNGCNYCNQSTISLKTLKDSELPKVLIGLFIEEPTPFIEYFFTNLVKLNYPKNRIHLFIHSAIEYHDKHIESFLAKFRSHYATQQVVKDYKIPAQMPEWQARNFALEKCRQLKCDYYLSLDSIARIEYPDALRTLIESNKTIIAPLLTRPGKLWSNFWASMTSDGYYARSHDYISLIRGDRLGIWNVPHVMNAYLINGKFIEKCLDNEVEENNQKELPELSYYNPELQSLKPTLTFTHQLRASNTFQYVINTHEFGHLVDPSSYNVSLTNPDFYQLKENMDDWEELYLHENYTKTLEEGGDVEKPCPDVSWFPLVSDTFCKHLIEIMEAFGTWSRGTNDDPRLEGGYESVPTRDIHMKQVGLHEMWLSFVHEYVMPIQLKEYVGYEHDPPHADLAFVVRYHPSEQAFLRPHHDSSTYTLNIALNTPHEDYEGGGCRFIRYNCSVTESRRGWALIHPGRLTHYHEGLPVTSGTRYIAVTFVDP